MGNKVTGGALKGLRLGEKVTGEVARVGHKVRDYGKMAGGIPGVGEGISKAADLAGSVGDAAASANKMIKGGEAGARGAQNALAAGNTQQALGIMRDTAKNEFASGKALKSQARSVLERARK
eukprot:COSAG02_NODE_2836_length_7923_cov_152.700153_4_plen_122_part_00